MTAGAEHRPLEPPWAARQRRAPRPAVRPRSGPVGACPARYRPCHRDTLVGHARLSEGGPYRMSMRPWARLGTDVDRHLSARERRGDRRFASGFGPGRGRLRSRSRLGTSDPRDRGRQVQRRDGAHRAARRRRLEPGALRGPARTSARTWRTPTSHTSSSCPRAPTPSRSSEASRARASTSSSARRSVTWTRWSWSPRSSRTRPSCT